MNIALWIVASVLALVFAASGASKVTLSRQALIAKGYGWAEDFASLQVILIGILEVLGALALVGPPALHIADLLSPIAAIGLAVMMSAAATVHVRRGETAHVAVPLVLVILSAALAGLRLGPYGF
ncbi:MAG: DoxX family protein [Nocardioides sp.]